MSHLVSIVLRMNWEKLPKRDGENLSLTGFLYQTQEGLWILSQQSNLKTCCIGSTQQQKTQIYLEGDFSSFSSRLPVCARGIFSICEDGRLRLSQAQISQKNSSPFKASGLGLVILFVCIYLIRKRVRAHAKRLERRD